MLPPRAISSSSNSKDASSAPVSLRATSSASGSWRSPVIRIPNSSPPSLATVSAARSAPWSLDPTCCSNSSPRSWPERVVDLLEAVQVEDHHPDAGPFTARRGDRLRGPILEQQPVRQPRQMVIHREPAVLVRATCELLPIPAHPSRRLDDDPEQHRPQQEQARRQHEVQPVRVRMDVGGDRRPRHVQLEGPDVLVAEPHRHVHLEELAELALRHVLRLAEIAHLGRELAVEALLQVAARSGRSGRSARAGRSRAPGRWGTRA